MKLYMKKLIEKYINTRKYYKKMLIILKLKMYASKNLESSINNYGNIMYEIAKLLNSIIDKDEDYKYIYLLKISIYENLDRILENLIIYNHDACLKIVRSTSEQLIIFKCLMQNEKYLMKEFSDWSIMSDYKNSKKGVELSSTGKQVFSECNLRIKKHIIANEPNINNQKLEKYVDKLINNKYGWYYSKCKTNYNITLKNIAKNEKCDDIYEMFKEYSEQVHNNNTRVLILQEAHNLSMDYHVLVLLLFIQRYILDIIKEDISYETYKCIYNKIYKNIEYNYKEMKYCEERYDKIH